MEDINLIYESTSDDDTSCEENKDKVKLIRKSSSKYKNVKNIQEPPPLNRLQKIFNERKNIIKSVEKPLKQQVEKQSEQTIKQQPVIQSIVQSTKNNINSSTLMLLRNRR